MLFRKKKAHFNYLVMHRELLQTDSVRDVRQLNDDVEEIIWDIENTEGGEIVSATTRDMQQSDFGVISATIEITYKTFH